MDPEYPFVGQECASYREFSAGYCDGNRRARFGIHSQRRAQGSFYFRTAPQQPYVQRRQGLWLDGVARKAGGGRRGDSVLRLWTRCRRRRARDKDRCL